MNGVLGRSKGSRVPDKAWSISSSGVKRPRTRNTAQCSATLVWPAEMELELTKLQTDTSGRSGPFIYLTLDSKASRTLAHQAMIRIPLHEATPRVPDGVETMMRGCEGVLIKGNKDCLSLRAVFIFASRLSVSATCTSSDQSREWSCPSGYPVPISLSASSTPSTLDM